MTCSIRSFVSRHGPRHTLWRNPRRTSTDATAIVFSIVALSCSASALEVKTPNDRTVTLRGYYKNFLVGVTGAPRVGGQQIIEDGVSDINRLRLMLDSDLSEQWEIALHYETIAEIEPRLVGGVFFESRDRPGLTPLSWSIERSGNLNWTHEIDRLYVRGRTEWGDLTVGRQVIGWGVGLLWSPLDLLIGFSPVQLDREYRLGVDAIRFLTPLGSFTEIEAVYAVYDTNFDDHASALRLRTTFPETGIDIGFIAGKYFEDAVIGGLVVGEVMGVGVHSSISLTHHFGDDNGPADFIRLVVGADYRFANNILGVIEYYFNGWGASAPSSYLDRAVAERVQRGEVFNLGRHYLGFALDWEAHPLVHLGARGQSNITDPSAQIGPLITVSLSDEANLEAGTFFAFGDGLDNLTPRSELGVPPDIFYAAAKIYF